MVSCCVPFCNSTTLKGSKFKRKVYEFPSNAEAREKWVKNISRMADNGKELWRPGPSGRDVVCEVHFTEDDFRTGLKIRRLKPEAAPTIFPGYPSYKQKTKKCRSPPKKRMLQKESPQIKQKMINEATIGDIITEDQETVFMDNLFKTINEKAKRSSLLRKSDNNSNVSKNSTTAEGQIKDLDNNQGNYINTSLSAKNKVSNAGSECSVVTSGTPEILDNISEVNQKTNILSTKREVCDDSENSVSIEQQAANLGNTNKGSCKNTTLSPKCKKLNAVSEKNVVTGTRARNPATPMSKKNTILLPAIKDNSINTNGQPADLSNINQGDSKTTPKGVILSINHTVCDDSENNVTNKGLSKNTVLSPQRKKRYAVSDNNATKAKRAKNLDSPTNRKKTVLLPQLNDAATDKVVSTTIGQPADLSNINQGDSKTTPKSAILSTKCTICDDHENSVTNKGLSKNTALSPQQKKRNAVSDDNATKTKRAKNLSSPTSRRKKTVLSPQLHDTTTDKSVNTIGQPADLSNINRGSSKTTPVLTKCKILTMGSDASAIANLQVTNLNKVIQGSTKAALLPSKHELSVVASADKVSANGQVTNKENYQNILLLIKRKIHGSGNKDGIAAKEQTTNLGNIQVNSKTTRFIIKSETNSLLDKSKLGDTANENCITVHEQVTNANISDDFHSAPFLDEHEICSAVTDDSITTDGQAVTSTSNETSNNTTLLVKHNSYIEEKNTSADEQTMNMGTNQENSENTPPSLSIEKQITSPEKLLARSSSQISTLQKKVQKLEHLLQMKDIALNDQLTKNILCVKSKSEEGDKSALFLLELLNNYGKDRRQWSDVTIRNCILWRRYYAKGYDFARQNGILHLPSKTTLKRFVNSRIEQSRTSFVVQQNNMGQSENTTSLVEKSS